MADEIINTTVRVRIFPEARRKLLTSRTGPVGVLTRLKANELAQAAKALVGKEYSGHHPNFSRMANSIRVRAISPEPSVEVIAEHPFALGHHEGTPSHVIAPRNFKVMYRENWFGPYGRQVRHPGTKANRFLINAAREVGLRIDLRGRSRTTFSSGESFAGVFRF